MSIQVANIPMANAVIGSSGKISWTAQVRPPTIHEQMQPQKLLTATLVVFNDSGCWLTCLFPISKETFTIPAGAWRKLYPPPGEVELDYTISARANGVATPTLFADYYAPGEPVDDLGVLGNSAVGVSAPIATQNINVDIQPTASGQKFTQSNGFSLNGATQTINAYLYAFDLVLLPVAGVICNATVDINAIVTDNAGNQIAGTPGYNFYHGNISSGMNNAAPFSVSQRPAYWQSSVPLWTPVNINVVGAFYIKIQIQFPFVSNANCHLVGSMLAGTDMPMS